MCFMPVLTSLFAHWAPPGLVLASCQKPGQGNKQCAGGGGGRRGAGGPCMFNCDRTLGLSLSLCVDAMRRRRQEEAPACLQPGVVVAFFEV